MIKNIICIECPLGCALAVEIKNHQVLRVNGQKCHKGELYGKQEIENPLRILTTVVSSPGLPLKIVPIRTNRPIPKARLCEAMQAINKIRLTKPVQAGEIIVSNFLDLKVDIIATRSVG